MADPDRQDSILNPATPALLQQLAQGTFPPAEFSHAQHLHAAWLCLEEAPLNHAIERYTGLLRAYTAHVGAADKYHHTLTVALLRLLDAARAPEQSWEQFLASRPALLLDAKSRVAQHYSPELLASAEARERYLPPDRLPLPGVHGHKVTSSA